MANEINTKAIVPNWTTLCNGSYFFNERTNQHSAVIITDTLSTNEVLTAALQIIYGKLGLESQLDEESISQYIDNNNVRIKETFTPPETNQHKKYLCVVNQAGFERVSAKLIEKKEKSDSISEGVGFLLEISRLDYEKLFSQLKNSLMKVGKEYEFAFRSGNYNVPGLRFGDEISKIESFDGKLRDFLEQNEVDLSEATLEKIGILFDTDTEKKYSQIKSIWSKTITQPWSKLENGFNTFAKSSPINDRRTLSFILNMPAISRRSESPLSYADFIKKYVYPPVKPLDINSLGLDTLGALGSFISNPAGNEVAGMLTSFPETFEDSIPTEFEVGYTRFQKEELENLLNDPNFAARRVQDSLTRMIPDLEPIVSDLVSKLGSIKNIQDLYTAILNPLGIKGIEELLSLAILEKIKNLPLDLAMTEIMASMIEAFPEEQIFLLYENIIGSLELDDVAAEIENAFVDLSWPSLFPDIPLPNVDDLNLPSITRQVAFDPSSIPRDKCLGTPMFSVDPNIGRIKLAFVNGIRQGFIKPESLSTILDRKKIGGSKNIFNNIFGLGSINSPSLRPPTFNLPNVNFGPKTRNPDSPSGAETRIRINIPRPGRAASKKKSGIPVLDTKKIYEKNRTRTKSKLGDITLPSIPEIPTVSLGSLSKIAIQKGEKQLEKVALKIGTLLLKKIVAAIFGPNSGGPNLGNESPDKKDRVKNILKNSLTGANANDKEVDKTINKILNSFSIWDPSKKIPTDRDVGLFMDAISLSLNPQQILDLFNGIASDETICQVRQAADSLPDKTLSQAIPSNGDISNMFAGLGNLINRNALQDLLDIEKELDTPKNPVDLCLTPAKLAALNAQKCAKLLEKGLTQEECDDQLAKEQERDLQDLSDLVKAGANPSGIFTNSGELPTKQSPDGPVISPMSSDPRDPNAGLFPMADESTNSAIQSVYQNLYDSINSTTLNDLSYGNRRNITSRGFLDMVLAGENGFPLHKNLDKLLTGDVEENFFGSPLPPDDISTLRDKYANPQSTFDVSLTLGGKNYIIQSEFDTIDFDYTIGGNLSITKSPTMEIEVDYQSNQSEVSSQAQQIVENISSPSNPPHEIFSDLIKSSLEENLKEALIEAGAAKEGDTIINKIGDYAKNILYNQILTRQIDLLSKSIYDNERAWTPASGPLSGSVGTPVKKTIDPDLGTFYIDFSGGSGPSNWLEIYLAANPISLFGDTPPIFNFDDLAAKSQQYFDSMPDDPRLELPDVEKIKESPFCRINSRLNNAGLAGLVKSIIRVYVYDALLKGTAVFQVYEMNSNNLGPLFTSYITEKILEDVMFESTKIRKILPNTLGNKGFYYIFLEQLVQSYANLTNLGIESTNSITSAALEEIKNNLSSWNPGNLTYINDFKDFLDDQIPSIKKILNVMVEEELNVVGQKTKSLYKPTIQNINNEIIRNSNWIVGGLNSAGPLSAPSTPPVANTQLGNNGWSGDISTYIPFVLESYVRQVYRNTGKQTIISPDDVDFSDLNSEYYAGTRIVLAMPDEFISRLIGFTDKMEKDLNNSREIAFGNTKSFLSDSPLTVPLISNETMIVNLDDQQIFVDLANDMLSTPEYEVLFNRCFSVPNLLSYLTIYNVENFVDSLSREEKKIGFITIPTPFGLWNGETFETTKKLLKSSMQQFYYGRSAEFVEEALEELNAASAMSSTLSTPIVEKAMVELGIPRKERKLLRDKPS